MIPPTPKSSTASPDSQPNGTAAMSRSESHARRTSWSDALRTIDRQERQKWIDPDAIRAFVDSAELLRPDHPGSMDIDVTMRSPEHAADRILEHIRTIR